ncbi:DUF4956 domain-containing protein [Saccharicrinis fermentans]|uniref:DUF4956 domain-containing protein n=1 Tax=Saccharicrinis fermentans DSM 9555 = JCM 21142 TaxID=869213 RepID=W7Y260_9BACT|nr:DUF4956 domain-containing protein [Saccharicrinis fermentans]GAF01603.1 hypothetical protein JCM21142_215 [Saccharicrinis fermentans DSM 9555 = JCM 21142]
MIDLNSIADKVPGKVINSMPSKLEMWEDGFRFLDIKIINVSDFTELLVRFAFNTILLFLVVHFMYARNSRRKDFYFSYLSIGVIVFLLSFLLNSVKLELGFALGLFAIFGIIRYRTDAIPIKEMTYLFIVIGISVINALANKKVSYAELIITNFVIVFGLWVLEKRLMLKQEGSVRLVYEKIENIHALKSDILLQDLKDRTGIQIKRYEIQKIDFLKDVAEIILYFNVNGQDKHKAKSLGDLQS